MIKKTVQLAVIILIVGLILTGCGRQKDPSGGSVHFRVTRDFGRQEIFAAKIQVSPGQSALEVLQQHLDVQTQHGGRFVTAIEGLVSDAGGKFRDDWFFYANGITASVGGADYYPREGDIIWWDYHPWGDLYFTPAVTGAFPEPFINGYRGEHPGSTILFTPAARDSANRMKAVLQRLGAQNIQVQPYGSYDLSNPRKITMVIALWQELSGEPFWQGMLENRQKIGWFVRLADTGFTALDLTGDREAVYSSEVGAILASGSGLGDSTPIWLLTALDEESLENTVNLIIERPGYLDGTFGVLVTGEEIIKLPL